MLIAHTSGGTGFTSGWQAGSSAAVMAKARGAISSHQRKDRQTDGYINCCLMGRKHQSRLPLKLPSWTCFFCCCFFCLRGESVHKPLCGAGGKTGRGQREGSSGHLWLPDSNEPALSVQACSSSVGANRTNSFYTQWVWEVTRAPRAARAVRRRHDSTPTLCLCNFIKSKF